MNLKLWLTFAVTEVMMAFIPGPAVLLTLSQGLRCGLRNTLNGIAGILTGNALYFLLSAAGLGALLVASTRAFTAVKVLGALYLIVMGVQMIIKPERIQKLSADEVSSVNPSKLFLQGLLTQLSNPKAILFFAALLPQFLEVGHNVPVQFLILGVTSLTLELPVLVLYGGIGEHSARLIERKGISSAPQRIGGSLLIFSGLVLGLTSH